MRERWTIEVEFDIAPARSGWDHVDGQLRAEVVNDEDGLLTAMLDGLHSHVHMTCEVILPWRVVKREPLTP